MSRRRALLVSEIFPPRVGGSGRWFFEMYRRFPPGEWLAVTEPAPGADAIDSGLPVVRVPFGLHETGGFSPRGARAYFRFARSLAAIAREHGATELHAARAVPEGWAALLVSRATGLPYICYAHGEDVNRQFDGAHTGVMSSRQHRWMARLVLGGASTVVANSAHTASIVTSQWGVPDERIRIIRPGVDVHRFSPGPVDDAFRAAHGWTGRQVVLTVGRLQERKGHDRMIDALAGMAQVSSQVLYAIVGDGEHLRFLRARADRVGVGDRVQFMGSLDDAELVRAYRSCDLFVLPNRQVGSDIEGFGMVLLEAQACGRAVLTGTSGGTREAMRPGVTGEAVDCADPRILETSVLHLLNDPATRAAYGAAGRAWVEREFDWDVVSRNARQTLAGS